LTDPVKLNIGGGDKLGAKFGYTNIDLRSLPKTDLLASIAHLPYASNSADEVLAIDVLEHVPRLELAMIFTEIYRVLKVGGVLKIKMPDLRALSEMYVADTIDTYEFSRKIYGNQEAGADPNFHKSGLDPQALESLLKLVGFKDHKITKLEGADRGNMGARAVKWRP